MAKMSGNVVSAIPVESNRVMLAKAADMVERCGPTTMRIWLSMGKRMYEIGVENAIVEAADTIEFPEPLGSVLRERRKQIERLGYSDDHDNKHTGAELAYMAAAYAHAAATNLTWPNKGNPHVFFKEKDGGGVSAWPLDWPHIKDPLRSDDFVFKPGDGSPRPMLVKAAALLLAEIDRLDRAAQRPPVERQDEEQKRPQAYLPTRKQLKSIPMHKPGRPKTEVCIDDDTIDAMIAAGMATED